MTENETKIVLEGAEYEETARGEPGSIEIIVKPKRIQTGWICNSCFYGKCIRMTERGYLTYTPNKTYRCIMKGDSVLVTPFGIPIWKPFYGEVVE